MSDPFTSSTFTSMIGQLADWGASTAMLVARDEHQEKALCGFLAMAGPDTPDNVNALTAALGIEAQPLPASGSPEDALPQIESLREAGITAIVYSHNDAGGAPVRGAVVMVTPEAAQTVEDTLAALDEADWTPA